MPSYQDVLITGVHTGLGRALAARCLEQGARVYALSREAPEDLAGAERARFVPIDLRRFDDVSGALEELLAGVGSLDLALLNAGVLGEIKDLGATSIDELRAVMDVNVWANKLLIDELMRGPVDVAQVLAISSGAAFNGSGGWGAYSISKSALNLLIRVFAHEHPETHFAALAPGVIRTPMIDYILARPEDPRYAANGRIRAAAAESRLLAPDVAADNILRRAPELLERPSGSYVDIRQM